MPFTQPGNWAYLAFLRPAAGWMNAILQGVEVEWVNPHVDTTFRFDETGEAHRYIEERKNIGKVILVP